MASTKFWENGPFPIEILSAHIALYLKTKPLFRLWLTSKGAQGFVEEHCLIHIGKRAVQVFKAFESRHDPDVCVGHRHPVGFGKLVSVHFSVKDSEFFSTQSQRDSLFIANTLMRMTNLSRLTLTGDFPIAEGDQYWLAGLPNWPQSITCITFKETNPPSTILSLHQRFADSLTTLELCGGSRNHRFAEVMYRGDLISGLTKLQCLEHLVLPEGFQWDLCSQLANLTRLKSLELRGNSPRNSVLVGLKKTPRDEERMVYYNDAMKNGLHPTVALATGFHPLGEARTCVLNFELRESILTIASLEFLLSNGAANFYSTRPISHVETHPLYLFLRMRKPGKDTVALFDRLASLDVPIYYLTGKPRSLNVFVDAAARWSTLYRPLLEHIFLVFLPRIQRNHPGLARDLLLYDHLTGDTVLHVACKVSVMPGQSLDNLKFLLSAPVLKILGWSNISECVDKHGRTLVQATKNPIIKKLLQLK